jgi:hypothetical protein
MTDERREVVLIGRMPHVVSVHRQAARKWIASAEYSGEMFEATGRTGWLAIGLWKELALATASATKDSKPIANALFAERTR